MKSTVRKSPHRRPSDENLSYLLARANRSVQQQFATVLHEANLQVEQWRILDNLSDGGGRNMSELARLVFMNLSALSKNIDRLVVRALVYRTQDSEDQRRVLVHISKFGLELLGEVEHQVADYHAGLTDRLGRTKTKTLHHLLQQLSTHD